MSKLKGIPYRVWNKDFPEMAYHGGPTPTRVQLRRIKGWRKPPNTVVVSRPSRFGNPFEWQWWTEGPWGVDPAQAKRLAAECFKEHLQDAIAGFVKGQFADRFRRIVAHLDELRDRNVACWCRLTDACHGDVYLELANREQSDE